VHSQEASLKPRKDQYYRRVVLLIHSPDMFDGHSKYIHNKRP